MTYAESQLLWSLDRLPDALEQLAAKAGYGAHVGDYSPPDPDVEPSRAWTAALASRLGIELEPVVPKYRELPLVIQRSGPAVLQVRRNKRPHYVVLLGTRRGRARILTPDSRIILVKSEAIAQLMREEQEARVGDEVDQLLQGMTISEKSRERVRANMLMQRLGERQLRTCWMMRPLPTARVVTLLGEAPGLLLRIIVNHALLSAVLAGSFWMLGRAALQAHLEMGWFLGWIALIASSIPLRMLEVWWQGLFSLRVGGILKQQLLVGVLKLTPDEVRLDGVGRHFGRVMESDVVEQLALGGGLLAVLSILDLCIAAVILAQGAGGWVQVSALLAWTLFAVVLARRHYAAQRVWSGQRIDVTHQLLERMIGHRTRLAQLPRDQWHAGEDAHLSGYHETSLMMDMRTTQLSALLPAGWLVIALLTLVPAFAEGRAATSSVAVSLGGTLLALRAFDEITVFFQQLSLAAASFEQIRHLLTAVSRPESAPAIPLEVETEKLNEETTDGGLIDARGLTFRHTGRSRSVLENCALQINRGDRILLEGPSGGGKSTLVALLTGLRTPDAGVLLLRGLDHSTFGARGWRRRVTAAPQFHENHVLAQSFAFNLLLGREWPASETSMADAAEICRDLGLEELVSRMPAGLAQPVGETGWQLSHGEKSRLFIARTLLQGAELVILDESFASLDPETMGVAVRCVLKRAPSVIVVCHP
jgi:ABC-type multidrug transport system fused ATPase/permease subunit